MTNKQSLPVPAAPSRALTAAEFHQLAQLPADAEWFANQDSAETRRGYGTDLKDFMRFAGISNSGEWRVVTRAHVIAWRTDLELRGLAGSTIRRKLSALSSLFDYLCNENAVAGNPVDGVQRPKVESYEGKTPALGDSQARQLLKPPAGSDLMTLRDRAMLSVMLYHGLRREEVSLLEVKDRQLRRGVPHLRVQGKGGKIRFVPLHPDTQEAIEDYLEAAGHTTGPLFRSTRKDDTRALTGDAIYKRVRIYAKRIGLSSNLSVHPHVFRATAATNSLDNGADLEEVQEWLGHANIQTTRIYDRRKSRPQDSPTFKVRY